MGTIDKPCKNCKWDDFEVWKKHNKDTCGLCKKGSEFIEKTIKRGSK